MKKLIHMVIVLGLVGLVSGASLVFTYRYARPLIEKNQKNESEKAIFEIIPGAVKYEAVSQKGEDCFKVYNKGGELIGYAFLAEGNGYMGNIKMIAGVKTDMSTFYGIEVLELVETPGLGGEITTKAFKSQFKDLKSIPQIICVKEEPEEGNEIQAITGATITSRSVAQILNQKLVNLRNTQK